MRRAAGFRVDPNLRSPIVPASRQAPRDPQGADFFPYEPAMNVWCLIEFTRLAKAFPETGLGASFGNEVGASLNVRCS